MNLSILKNVWKRSPLVFLAVTPAGNETVDFLEWESIVQDNCIIIGNHVVTKTVTLARQACWFDMIIVLDIALENNMVS